MEATINAAVSVAGLTFYPAISRAAASGEGHSPVEPLAAGKAGTLTGRTDDDTGVVSLGSGHGLITSDVVDAFWAGGSRHGMDVAMSGDDATIDGGGGDALPVLTTPMVLSKRTTLAASFDGDDLVFLAVQSDRRARFSFEESSAVVLTYDTAAGEGRQWAQGMGETNPLAGHVVDAVTVSNGDAENQATVGLGVLFD